MGYWSDKSVQAQDDYEWARRFLGEVGVLDECENHPGTFYDGSEPLEEAYKAANSQITSGKVHLRNGQSRRDVTDLLKAVYDDNSALGSCQECDRNFGPD